MEKSLILILVILFFIFFLFFFVLVKIEFYVDFTVLHDLEKVLSVTEIVQNVVQNINCSKR